jgi:hypothetical protein
MRRLAVAAFVLIVSAVATHRAAHADDSWRPLFDLRLEPGVMIPAEHLQPKGEGGNPPPFYLGLTAETRLVGPVYASATGGVSFALMSCGTDTCTAYLKAGDLVAGLRVGLGYAF